MNKKIIRTISWILLFLFINHGDYVKATYVYTIDSSWVTIDTTTISNSGKTLNEYINDLIISQPPGNKNFYIEDGTYTLSDSIRIDVPGVNIYGQSKTNTKLIQTNPGAKSIVVTESNIHVSNLYIDGSAGQQVFHAQNGLNVHDVGLVDCIIYGSNIHSAISFYGQSGTDKSLNNTIQGNEIHSPTGVDAGSTMDGAVVFYWQKDAVVKDNTIIGSRLWVNECENLEVSTNTIKDSAAEGGIRVNLLGENIKIINNTIENITASAIAVVDEASTTNRYSGIEIRNNNIITSKYFGIEVRNLKNAIISGNTVDKINFEGIYLLYSDNLTIQDNTVSNCGLYNISGGLWPNNLNSGIFIDTEVKNSIIKNNTISNVNNCPYGIRIQPVEISPYYNPQNTNNRIENNIITGNFTEGISVNEGSPENTYNPTIIVGNIIPEVAEDNIILTWDEIAGITDYEVEVDGSSTIVSVSNTSYTHSGLEIKSNHKYRVRVKYGKWSSEVSATTLPVPKNITTSTTASSVRISWDEVSGVTGYLIELDGNSVVDVGMNREYISNGLASNSTHSYRVKIKGGQWSDSVIATTSALPPPPPIVPIPANIRASTTASCVQISWDGVSGATGYLIELDGDSVVDVGLNTEYIQYGVASNSTHHYRVKINGGQWSPIVSATTSQLPIIIPENIKKSSHKKHKASNNYILEFAFGNQETLNYKEQFNQNSDDDILRRMILYTFGEQYYLKVKAWENNEILLSTQLIINLIPGQPFTDSEIRNISIDENDNIDTILVQDMSSDNSISDLTDKIGLSEYSIDNGYIFSIGNTGMQLKRNESYSEDVQ